MAVLLNFLRRARTAVVFLLGWILILLGWASVLPRFLLKSWLVLFSLLLTIVLAILLVEILWVSPRDIAYRYVSPADPNHPNACDAQQRNPSILAAYENSEDKVQLAHKGEAGLECMLQYHVVPSLPTPTWYNSDKPIG